MLKHLGTCTICMRRTLTTSTAVGKHGLPKTTARSGISSDGICTSGQVSRRRIALPKQYTASFDTLEALLTEVGLYPDGCLNALALKCVWHCDEKGMESLPNGNLKQQRVVAPKCCGKKHHLRRRKLFWAYNSSPIPLAGCLGFFRI